MNTFTCDICDKIEHISRKHSRVQPCQCKLDYTCYSCVMPEPDTLWWCQKCNDEMNVPDEYTHHLAQINWLLSWWDKVGEELARGPESEDYWGALGARDMIEDELNQYVLNPENAGDWIPNGPPKTPAQLEAEQKQKDWEQRPCGYCGVINKDCDCIPF